MIRHNCEDRDIFIAKKILKMSGNNQLQSLSPNFVHFMYLFFSAVFTKAEILRIISAL